MKSLKEAACVWIHVNMMVSFRLLTAAIFISCLLFGNLTRYLSIAYIIWLLWDWNTPRLGGRPWNWHRRGFISRNCINYFPVRCVKLTDIPANKNYIAVNHPHGILAFGATFTFCADLFQFNERFGLRQLLCTLNINYMFPLVREYILGAGTISADSSSIRHQLECHGTGNVVAVSVGGAEEANYNKTGVYKVVLTKRTGFCRLALQTGAHLLPTFSFNEVDVYDIDEFEANALRKMFQNLTGVNFKLFQGVPSWLYIFGLPRRRPITVVMGKPIPVEKKENPTPDDIKHLHAIYVKSIKTLFDTEKHKYLENPNTELIIV